MSCTRRPGTTTGTWWGRTSTTCTSSSRPCTRRVTRSSTRWRSGRGRSEAAPSAASRSSRSRRVSRRTRARCPPRPRCSRTFSPTTRRSSPRFGPTSTPSPASVPTPAPPTSSPVCSSSTRRPPGCSAPISSSARGRPRGEIVIRMRCPRCATELPDSAKFCLECGQPLGGSPAVAASFASPAAYTPKHLAERILTSRAALEGERKQVTVLFCDLANSTPLAERIGPERMHGLLNGFFELALGEVHRYEGTVNQFLGDGFMALFGAPLAHEDDARRAVLAAITIRRALRDRGSYMGGSDLAVRIGVNTGLVVVGSIGVDLRMDYTAVGDTTNVAARLQQMAEPGDILISEATARLVRSEARLLPAGALTVKGKSEPVTAYKVLGRLPRRSALERAGERAFGRFVGRERELRALGDVLSGAQQCQGRLVRIVGEAGSGKSRLLYEFRRTLGGLDLTVLEGRCRSYGSALPYLPITDLVRAHCGIADADTPEVVGDKVRATLESLGLDTEE